VIEVGERRGMRSGRVGRGGRRRWRVGVVGAEVVRELSRWKIPSLFWTFSSFISPRYVGF